LLAIVDIDVIGKQSDVRDICHVSQMGRSTHFTNFV